MPAVVPRFVNHPAEVRWPGEELGASNHDVFVDLLGLDAAELTALEQSGVV